MAKVFIGAWINEKTRKQFKVACAVHEVTQEDIIDLLIAKWVKEPHIMDEVKEIING
jgi:hypothetical protein|tara:strand:- start:852 stop:1022 length:171 start_codon:yes stop_codon:yes gene_type:complete